MKTISPSWLMPAIEQQAHLSWHEILFGAAADLDASYLHYLSSHSWLPGSDKIFSAFSIPKDEVKFILYGESPYPRAQSAIGYAFWDGAVSDIWSAEGLSKAVNRATSLRNFLKMLVMAETGVKKIVGVKEALEYGWVRTLDELFANFLRHGFLLLNFNLSLSQLSKKEEARYWRPFHVKLLEAVAKEYTSPVELILFGKIAENVLSIPAVNHLKIFRAEHPYNLSFIENTKVLDFFSPLHLLSNRHVHIKPRVFTFKAIRGSE